MQTLEKVAKSAVEKVVADLTDRRGLRQAWEAIDPEIQAEIVREWQKIVEQAFDDALEARWVLR